MIQKSKNIEYMYCIKCNSRYEVGDYYTGCPKCFAESTPASLTFNYKFNHGDENFKNYLPYSIETVLGEGNTPIIEYKKISERYDIASFYIKNEFQNPTGSHKDRMSPNIIARAIEMNKKGVVAASSGNAGVSLASYASKMGSKCTIIVAKSISPIYRRAIEVTGAEMIYTDTSMARWEEAQKLVENEGWYPATNYINPPVGSNPFGVQGYKNIAFEIYEYFKMELPTCILIPVARGDLLWGIYEGFDNLLKLGHINKIPKMIAIEPIPRIERVLKGENYTKSFKGDYSKTPSIGGQTITYQSVKAIKDTKGDAITVSGEEIPTAMKILGSSGLYLETSSALGVKALDILKERNIIDSKSRVLMIATSHGYKD